MIFITIITSVLILSGGYLYLKLTNNFAWFKTHSIYVLITLVLFVILQILGPMSYRLWPSQETWPFILQWLTYISLGFFSCVMFYFLLAELTSLLLKPILSQELMTERRVILGVGILSIGNALLGLKKALEFPVVEKVEVKYSQLPEGLEKLKIVQISDLHVGPTIKKNYVESVVEQTMAQSPDLIVLTGDFADGHVSLLRDDIAPIQNLKAPLGVFYVTGNHEYYWNGPEWIQYFKSCGFEVLLNEHRVVEHQNALITVAGVTDLKAGQFDSEHACDPHKALAGCPVQSFKILLAHQPNTFHLLSDSNQPFALDLQLSGHTHGGQFFPWSMVVGLVQKYLKGLYLVGSTYIYVNRGTGYWGPPIRYPQNSEITLLEITRQQNLG